MRVCNLMYVNVCLVSGTLACTNVGRIQNGLMIKC